MNTSIADFKRAIARATRLLTLASVGLALSAAAGAQSATKAAGVVAGEVITEEQVLRAMTGPAPRGDRERLETMHRALDSIVEARVLAAEAAKQQVPVQAILEAEVDSNVVVPSEAQVAGYYERNKTRISVSRDQALPLIRQQLAEASRTALHAALLRRLKREHGFKSFLEPLRTDVAVAGHPARGPADAPVTIVEFSHFECPFCGALFPALKALEREYPDTVRLVYRHFPLVNSHPHAQKAAEASLCAAEQGRFWEMHDSLFGFQQDLTIDSLRLRAMELGLDVPAFNACLDSGKQAERIKQDMADAARAGVTGTPTLFINGRMVVGSQPAEIRAIIDDELERAGR